MFKNPFASDDSAGIVSMLVGMIVLVFAALGLSLLMEGGIPLAKFASSTAEFREENDALKRRINDFETHIHTRKLKSEQAAVNGRQAELLADLKNQLNSARTETGILKSLIKNTEGSIQLIVKGQETHKLRYRDHIRATAPGETFDSIENRLGELFKHVKIIDITAGGISISHSTGVSRLDYREMPEAWRKKYMYTANEVAAYHAAEQKREAQRRRNIARSVRATQKVKQTESRLREIAALRRKIASVAMKYSSTSLEASLAQNKVSAQNSLNRSRAYSNSNYGYRRYNTGSGTYQSGYYRPRYRITLNARQSVPGRLETWEGRAVRYQRAAARYASHLASLRAQLSALDPSYQPVILTK